MKKIYNYINFITKKIINDKNINRNICDAQDLGLFLRNNISSCYSLGNIEEILIKRIIERIGIDIAVTYGKEIGFIVSEPFDRGGHTRLMENLASFLDEKPILFVTRKGDAAVLQKLRDFFGEINNQSEEVYIDEIDKIIKFAKEYARLQKIVLNIHPDDIQAVVAVGLAKYLNPALTIYFVNHADHSFTYGTSVSDFWFEISIPGKKIDDQRQLKAKKSFLGIPVKNIPQEIEFKNICDGDVFLTAGSAIKFKPKKCYSLLPLMDALLKNYAHSIIYVIGCRPYIDFWWWPLKFKYRKRLILKKSLPYEEYLLLTSQAKVYIDSHPYPGGTAFAEQYISGKRCIGLKSPVQGYSPAELLKKDTVYEVLRTINIETNIRELIAEVHGPEKVKSRFIDTIYNSVCSANICEEKIPWAGDAFFLENEKLVRVPRSYKVLSLKTLHLFKFCSAKIILLFYFEKTFFFFKKLMSVK